MKYFTTQKFWNCYNRLPPNIRGLADKNFKLLKQNPQHPSLKLKQIREYWSVRVGLYHRALGINAPDKKGIIWFWIGNHPEYERLLRKT